MLKVCDICVQAALKYGGDVESVPIDERRHWRPKNVWRGVQKKVKEKTVAPIFCRAGVQEPVIPEFGNYSRNPSKRSTKRSGIMLG